MEMRLLTSPRTALLLWIVAAVLLIGLALAGEQLWDNDAAPAHLATMHLHVVAHP